MKISLPVHFHQGKTLIDVSNTYPTMLKAILEAVQNAIDNDAMHVWIDINRKKLMISVADDGEGAGVADVEEAFKNVNDTLKKGKRRKTKTGRTKSGRYGKGLFAPLTKCQYFSFISSPKGANQYLSFRFDQKKIKAMKEEVLIEGESLPNMVYEAGVNKVRKHRTGPDTRVVDWATRVTFHNYSTDRVINNILSADDVVKAVFRNFGRTMHEYGVRLSVRFTKADGTIEERKNVEAPKFTGTPMGRELRYHEAHRTVFELYLAAKDEKGKPGGEVLVGEHNDPFTFSFREFANSVMPYNGLLSTEARDGLLSGHFEGEILAGGAVLHKDRDKFVMSESVISFCTSINEWFEEVGKGHVLRLEGARKNERYQRLARESMQTIEAMIRQPQYSYLGDLMDEFKEGTVGEGHAEPDPENIVGKQDEKSVATIGGDGPPPTKNGGATDGSEKPARQKKAPPPGQDTEHRPMSVVGPSGKRRTIVRETSLGLQIVHDSMEGDDRLWMLDSVQGLLFFNIRHPVWVACDGEQRTAASDRRVRQLQETVTIIALQWFFAPEEQKPMFLQMMDDFVSCQVFLYQQSAAFNLKKLT